MEWKVKRKVALSFFPRSVAMVVGSINCDDGVVGVGKGGDIVVLDAGRCR